MRILAAEDDITSRIVLENALKRFEHDVTIVKDGAQALSAYNEGGHQLLLLDWMMPNIDGIEVCRIIRSQETLLPPYIIMITAKNEIHDIVSALDTGANDFIKKPFNNGELAARIRVGERVITLQQHLAQRISELEDAQKQIRTLQGIIPICMHCHKVRDEAEIWRRLESYISEHTDAMLTHGLCPECRQKYYPEVKKSKRSKKIELE